MKYFKIIGKLRKRKRFAVKNEIKGALYFLEMGGKPLGEIFTESLLTTEKEARGVKLNSNSF